MKGLKFAIEWIAMNDAPADDENIERLTGYLTVALVADLFDKEQEEIARRVYEYRQKTKGE